MGVPPGGVWRPDQADLRATARPGGAAVMRAESAIGIGLDEGRSRYVVAIGWRFAGAEKAGMGGRAGRDRTGPAIRPGGLAG
jgi:hypothetical protein